MSSGDGRYYADKDVDVITGIESAVSSSVLAYEMGLGLVPIRKPGKLPTDKLSVQYTLEYGTDSLEIHRDAIVPGQRTACR